MLLRAHTRSHNNQDAIIGIAIDSAGDGGYQAFVATGNSVRLLDRVPGAEEGRVDGINDAGLIVGAEIISWETYAWQEVIYEPGLNVPVDLTSITTGLPLA
jgi:hypothetical protein